MIIYILLGMLYVLIGMFVGYFVFDEDEYGKVGPLLGILSWPILLIVFIAGLTTVSVYWFTDSVVRFFKRIKKIKRKKSKESLGHGTDEEKFTKCDKCDRFDICRAGGKLLEITKLSDSNRHYILGRDCVCYLDLVDKMAERIDQRVERRARGL